MSFMHADLVPEAPENAEAFNRRGWAFYIQGEVEKAENDFRSAIEHDQNYVDAVYGLALSRKNNSREAEWRPLFERTIQLLEAGHLDHNRPRAVILRHLAQTQLTYLPEKDWKPEKE